MTHNKSIENKKIKIKIKLCLSEMEWATEKGKWGGSPPLIMLSARRGMGEQREREYGDVFLPACPD